MAEPAAERKAWAIAVHGGAGVINSTDVEWLQAAKQGLAAALDAGVAVLAREEPRGSALDAVVAAVAALEDHASFNAGRGSVLNAAGEHELEASVMTHDQACGAATLLRRTKNPVRLAKLVMEESPHILLAGEAAEAFGEQHGLEQVASNAAFTTPQRQEQWQRYREQEQLAPHDEIVQHTQTVGAVALDSQGRLAAATSTGGRTNKWAGRIGDTPVLGAGNWADERCALSGTGVGEEFLRRAAAHDVAARVAYKGLSLQDAMREVVFGSFREGDGGFVGVDAQGNIAMEFNAVGMYRAAADSSGAVIGPEVFRDGALT